MKHGAGRASYSNDSLFIGEWRDNIENGFGIMKTTIDQLIYSGNFVNGMKNGLGEIHSVEYKLQDQNIRSSVEILNDMNPINEQQLNMMNDFIETSIEIDSKELHVATIHGITQIIEPGVELLDLLLTGRMSYIGNWFNNLAHGYGQLITISGVVSIYFPS